MARVYAIDADEIVFNYIDPFIAFINAILGTNHVRSTVTSYSFEDSGVIPKGTNNYYVKAFGDSGGIANLPLMPGAQRNIQKLLEKDSIFYVTSRSSDYYSDTEAALVANGIWAPMLFSTKAMPKAQIIRAIGAVALLDDSPTFINEVLDHTNSKAILMTNIQGSIDVCRSPYKVKSWDEAYEELTK